MDNIEFPTAKPIVMNLKEQIEYTLDVMLCDLGIESKDRSLVIDAVLDRLH